MKEIMSGHCERIGAGAFGTCYLVEEPSTLRKLAVKKFSKRKLYSLVDEAITLKEAWVPGV